MTLNNTLINELIKFRLKLTFYGNIDIENVTVNAYDCGFDPHSRKLNIY